MHPADWAVCRKPKADSSELDAHVPAHDMWCSPNCASGHVPINDSLT